MSLMDEIDEVAPRHPPQEPVVREVTPGAVHPLAAQLERCRPWLEESMGDSMLTWDQISKLIFQGKVQFWPGENAAMVTEIEAYENTKALQVITAGGSLEELKEMAHGVEAFGRMMQCEHVIVEGRKGWEKALKSAGYEFYSITVRKKL